MLGSENYRTGWRTKIQQDKQIISSCPLKWKWKLLSRVWLCDPMDCMPGSPVHEILQGRLLAWVAVPSSRGSSQLRTQVSCTAGGFFTSWATREDLLNHMQSYLHKKQMWLRKLFLNATLTKGNCIDPWNSDTVGVSYENNHKLLKSLMGFFFN